MREFSPYAVTQLRAILRRLLDLDGRVRHWTDPAERDAINREKAFLFREARIVGFTQTMVKALLRRLREEGHYPPDSDEAMAKLYASVAADLDGRHASIVLTKSSPLDSGMRKR